MGKTLLAKIRWRVSCMLFKNRRKVIAGCKIKPKRNIGHRHIRILQKDFGRINLQRDYISMRRDSQFFFKLRLEPGRGKPAELGNTLNTQIFCQMGVNISQCLLDIRAVEFSGHRDIVGTDIVHNKLQKAAVSNNLFLNPGRTEALKSLQKQRKLL